ncbi:manganese efflux pump [Siculibacillus lacustris]|uniref:Putative manganese efflux pump MntP n=1 Tax=Siculibacillus lacustris TaxID=1549641 RepID=A0A4Q9VUI5_9HYPH|nr:manganese efflux pump MntP family protein [Siculibacillus lacustris]TBW39803.1 manganese efflux pump [Siculibacillus lacustris]
MSLFSLMILALGLSVDAFAAAVGRGAAGGPPRLLPALGTGLVFGFVEMLTPVIGWALGSAFAGYVEAVDHWIAFALLTAVGGRMAWCAVTRTEDAPPAGRSLLALVCTAIGTSIDAMAVGVSLALLDVDIRVAAAVIGTTTFVMATIGLLAGRMIGERAGTRAEVGAGVGLALLGCAILWQHSIA